MAGRMKRGEDFDAALAGLPPELRRREWMGRVEAAIFASPVPVSREKLALLVGPECRLDALIEDIRDELHARPYDLVSVAGGWQHRTRPRFAAAIRAIHASGRSAALDLTPTESLVATAIACLQPATRARLSDILGREVSRDTVARLKKLGLVAAGPRAPLPGAPSTYVTTRYFLSVFGLASLRDLPDIEALVDAGFLQNAAWDDGDPRVTDAGSLDALPGLHEADDAAGLSGE